MSPRRRSFVPRLNASPRPRAGGPARGRVRPGPRRQPWIFGASRPAPEPYVFTTPTEPDGADAGATAPAGPPPEASADAPVHGGPEPATGGDGPGGDGPPAEHEDYDQRRRPKRDPSPRGVVGVSAKLTWHQCLLTRYPLVPLPHNAKPGARLPDGFVPHGSGVYIVCRGDVPIYVGEAGSFRERWNARLLEAYQAGVIETTLDKPVTLWCGVLQQPLSREARRTVEAAIIRVLIKGNVGGKLRQGTSFNEFRPGTPIDVDQVLPPNLKVAQIKPDNRLHVAANNVFEAALYELAPAS
jgi:hypothetical protein